MALDELLEALRVQSEAEARSVLDAARATVQRLEAESRERLEIRREARRQATIALRSTQRAQAVAEARSAARERELLARRDWLERVFAAAARQLEETSEAHPVVELAEALRYLPGGRVVARCRPELAASVRRILGPEVEVHEDPEAPAGVVLRDADDRVRLDLTLAARLRAARPWLAARLVASEDPP